MDVELRHDRRTGRWLIIINGRLVEITWSLARLGDHLVWYDKVKARVTFSMEGEVDAGIESEA